MDPKTFMISHVNSYTGKILLEELSTSTDPMIDISQYQFHGTLQHGTNQIYTATDGKVPDKVSKVVKMSRTRDFRNCILDSDVIIYDLMTNDFEEVDYVIKTLKTSKLEKQKTLIIISSVMTWVNTPPKLEVEGEDGGEGEEGAVDSDIDPDDEAEEGEEEEEDKEEEEPEEEGEDGEEKAKPPKVKFFKESDYVNRVPHERFIAHKNLETLALSAPKAQPMLKVHILCGGIRYGHGEGIFYDYFKNAWLQKPDHLQVLGDGKNLIPTIHIRDLARTVRRVIDDEVKKSYIFCVDKTKKPTQRRLVEAISKGIGTGKIKEANPHEIPDSIFWKAFMLLNLMMRSSSIYKKKALPEGEEGEEEDEAKLKFPWHCKKGIIKNARTLNEEFNVARDLKPVKIMITGPPAVGKTFYAEKIA